MLIQRQFHLAYAAVIGATLIALWTFFFMHSRLRETEELRTWANAIVKSVLDCDLLGSESILQENARAREQYASASANLQRLIDHPPDDETARRFVPEVAASKSRIDSLLNRFSLPPNTAHLSREDRDLQTMLASQWMLQTRSLLNAAQELRTHATQESARFRGLNLLSGCAAIFFVAIVTGLIFIRSYKTLVAPLRALGEGARRIGAGELAHRVKISERNEIGMVAESFNAMAEQLSARQAEVEEKIRDLEAFSYSVAHDLKAPLRSVAGYGTILESDYADRLDADGKDYIHRIRSATLRMSALIDDLLQFGQLTHKHVEIQPVSLKSVCGQLLTEMQGEISARGADVQFCGDDARVLANEVLLKQALRNLVSNGMKFVAQGVSPVIRIRTKPEARSTVIEVCDNGIGIAPEHQKKIFGLFHRLHSQTEFPGTGIGLAIVQKSIERLRGRIGVNSKIGEGSVFWLELPNAS